jgi:hypothetical protein
MRRDTCDWLLGRVDRTAPSFAETELIIPAAMHLTNYKISNERRRLSGRTEWRGSQMGLPTWGGFAFGAVFIASGILMCLVGTKTIAVDPKGVQAPYWILTVCGSLFSAGGLFVWGMTLRQWASKRRRAEFESRPGAELALADYAWNPRGYEPPRWRRVVKSVVGAAFMTFFLSVFNWWAFFANGPFMVKAIVVVFDAILLAVWWGVAMSVGRAFKFGGSRIEFARFPYGLTEPVSIHWKPATGIEQVNRGMFTLRCVEEWFENRGSGRNRSRQLVHEEVWSGTWHLGADRSFPPPQAGGWVELQFELPADAPSTRLSADRPIFWELEVHLELPGLDFRETYLVPVYSR